MNPASAGRRILVLPDVGRSAVRTAVWRNIACLLAEHRPDEVLCMAPAVASCRDDEERGQRGPLAEALSWIRAHFEGRIRLQTHAAAKPFSSTVGWAVDAVVADSQVEVIEGIHEVAPGWLSVCAAAAHPWPYPGSVAISLARLLRQNILCAGTHVLGAVTESGRGASQGPLQGVEVGSLAAATEPGRSRHVGFAVVDQHADAVRVTPVAIARDGAFEIDGQVFSEAKTES